MAIKNLCSSKIFDDNSFIENIAFGKEIEKIDKDNSLAAKKSQIHDFIIKSENGYSENANERELNYQEDKFRE